MVAAWQRLGVPPDIAEYLALMDISGQTIIKTEHAKLCSHIQVDVETKTTTFDNILRSQYPLHKVATLQCSTSTPEMG